MVAVKQGKKVIEFGEKYSPIVLDWFGNIMRKVGGGERAVVLARLTSPELISARNSYKGAEMSHNLATERYKEASQQELALLDRSKKWKNPNSTKNLARLNEAAGRTRLAENKAITTSQKARLSRERLNNTKRLVTSDAMRKIRNKGIKRTALAGGLGTGAFLVFPRGAGEQQSSTESTPLQYMYDPNNGWLEFNLETGLYENQLLEFGVDRFGNTNYYDGTNWLTPDLYMQGSNGYIYNKQTGQVIGTTDDTLEAHNSGYDSVFDYRAAKAGYNSPEAVKELLLKLGINADGKWGQQTLDAFNRIISDWEQQYNPNSLFSIYQRKQLYGY